MDVSILTKFTIAILTAAGCILLLNLNPNQAIKQIKSFQTSIKKHASMKERIDAAKGIQKQNRFAAYLKEAKDILDTTERSSHYVFFCRISALLAVIGASIGIVTVNYSLMIVLAAIGAFSPLLYLRYTSTVYKKQVREEIKTSLDIITNSYMRKNDLVAAVAENIDQINPPIRPIFEQFLAQTKFVSANIVEAITDLQEKLPSPVFKQWCDALILCQSDGTKKEMLQQIVNKFIVSDQIQNDLEIDMYKPMHDAIVMIITILVMIPILFLLNRQWVIGMTVSSIGKFSIALLAAAVFFLVVRAIRAIRPVEYKM